MIQTSALLDAINKDNFEQAKELLNKGESFPPELDDFNKRQVFDKLIKNKAFDIVNLLVENKTIETDLYEYDSFSKTFFESLINYFGGDEESINFVNHFIGKLSSINDELSDGTLLSYALENKADITLIKALVNGGCDINYTNTYSENLIHLVVSNNRITPEKGLEYLQFLIDGGVDINMPNIVKKTPLIKAVDGHKASYLDILLENGAHCNDIDNEGNTAFFYAVAQQLDLDFYNKLREYDIPDFELINRNGVSILFEYLRIMYGNSTKEIELLNKLVEDGAELTYPSVYYGEPKTPLDLLAEKKTDVLQSLLKTCKIEINNQDDKGNTLLHKVCEFNINFDREMAKETYRKVKLLLEEGADASLTNDKDETPLTLASKDDLKVKTVELLLTQK
ncbi:ankyrin repeat domain-containing protein [Pedobacter punctiformis]|uniref:Ankyrin repeat domain-containing protein n=1 Tax=Pedobacter punctiformis TaxID=3004097 RepID=A0ABT4L9A3_9SPHI|nr:ankyrin repeat domain-containing protein [Pedobacter sp. HCMS5-2]MCZ4244500.1 ankyrin repeat domain-containing protein [Pedobacter sp. HCMS5-2]